MPGRRSLHDNGPPKLTRDGGMSAICFRADLNPDSFHASTHVTGRCWSGMEAWTAGRHEPLGGMDRWEKPGHMGARLSRRNNRLDRQAGKLYTLALGQGPERVGSAPVLGGRSPYTFTDDKGGATLNGFAAAPGEKEVVRPTLKLARDTKPRPRLQSDAD